MRRFGKRAVVSTSFSQWSRKSGSEVKGRRIWMLAAWVWNADVRVLGGGLVLMASWRSFSSVSESV